MDTYLDRPQITAFRGDHKFLSNFYRATIYYEGLYYPSTEHAYQAAKSLDPDEREKIASLRTEREAKAAGYKVKKRHNWDDIRISIMRDILRIKFAIPQLKDMLLNTQGYYLIEGNNWNDRFWGAELEDGKWVGENHLGKLLMEIREDIQH